MIILCPIRYIFSGFGAAVRKQNAVAAAAAADDDDDVIASEESCARIA